MKAITLLVALALFALASALSDQSADKVTSGYAWWWNLNRVLIAVSTYLACLSSGWVTAFLVNDGGTSFELCLMFTGNTANWSALITTP